jgi:hypothetical protein
MDVDFDADLDAEAYDALGAELAAEAAAELPERSRPDAVWDAVGAVVPRMTDAVCERVLELAEHEPDDALVEQVTEERESDDAETLRAEALTALVADVEERVAARDE